MTNNAVNESVNLRRSDNKRRGDILLLFSVIALSLIGLVFVYSASRYNCEVAYNDKFYTTKKTLRRVARRVCRNDFRGFVRLQKI